MPEAEVDIDSDLVRRLLTVQHPDLAGLELTEIANGWDNVMFRLGDDYVVRLPRREQSAELIEYEQRWLPETALRLPIPIPVPIRFGKPSSSYPWHWSVLPWLDGTTLGSSPVSNTRQLAIDLGEFLRAMHIPAPADSPVNDYRGVPLAERSGFTLERLDGIADITGTVDADLARKVWQTALEAELWSKPPVWLHGDMHPLNLLQTDGRLSAVIDFGDITSGDPASDLGVAWMLFDSEDRALFREIANSTERVIDDPTWERARGWALSIALMVLANSADNPLLHSLGEITLEAVLSDGS